MVLLGNDSFLSELTYMYEKSKESGAVSITMKRYNPSFNKPKPSSSSSSSKSKSKSKNNKAASKQKNNTAADMEVDNQILMRAVSQNHNRKKKISTLVSSRDWSKFSAAYGNLLRANVDGLQKRSKKDRRLILNKKKAGA
eukprot:Nk52_evm1s1334 gene=Nk52_evmTU1s1334